MQLVQFLSCNVDLGTCCRDGSLALLLKVAKNILDIIQLIVPILLIVMSAFQFIKLMSTPDEKNGLKKLYNKYIAAVIVFFVPIFVEALVGLLPQTSNLSACWEQANINKGIVNKSNYVSPTDDVKKKMIVSDVTYERGEPKPSPSPRRSVTGGSGNGSATGKAIVDYALSFVGQPYVWGGVWNGELPYTGTDCSGFVQGVFKHNGINLTRTTYTQWDDTSSYTLVNSGEIRAGDLVMYDGHVALLTGNGNQVVHAKGPQFGIVIDDDYRYCSSHGILGIMRINGVN